MTELCPKGTPSCSTGNGWRHDWEAADHGVVCAQPDCHANIRWDAFNHWWALRATEDLKHVYGEPDAQLRDRRIDGIVDAYHQWCIANV